MLAFGQGMTVAYINSQRCGLPAQEHPVKIFSMDIGRVWRYW